MSGAHVAFFRDLNQGQRGDPSTADLVAAFAAAGAMEAVPFRGNGTVVVTAPDPEAVAETAAASLPRDRPTVVFVRALQWLAAVAEDWEDGTGRRELTLFDAGDAPDTEVLERMSRRGRCSVIALGSDWAIVENHVDRSSNGTPVLEAALGRPTTSRGLATILALVERFASG